MTLRLLLIIMSFLAINQFAAADCNGRDDEHCDAGEYYDDINDMCRRCPQKAH